MSIVIFIYEYFITLSTEVKYFWGRKLTGATALFFLNRYVPLILNVLGMISFATMSDKVCCF